MKKVLVGVACASILFLTGCGGEKLTCTQKDESDGMTTTQEMNIHFSKDKMSKLSMKASIKFPDDMKESLDTFYKNMESQYKKLDETDGMSAKVSKSKDTLTTEISLDVNKAKDQLSSIGFSFDDDLSKEDLKKSMEDSGYSCK